MNRNYNIDELKISTRAARQRLALRCAAMLIGFVVLMGIYGRYCKLNTPEGVDEFGRRFGLGGLIVANVTFVLGFVATMLGLRRAANAFCKDSSCHCGNCRAALHISAITTASRSCPNCGVTVLRDIDSIEERNYDTIPSMSNDIQPTVYLIEAFRAEAQLAERREKVGGLIGALCAFGIAAIGYWLFWSLGINNDATIALALGLLFAGLFIVEILNRDFQSRLTTMKCPHCRKSLIKMTPVVIATRNCGHCGRRVLADPETHSPNIQP